MPGHLPFCPGLLPVFFPEGHGLSPGHCWVAKPVLLVKPGFSSDAVSLFFRVAHPALLSEKTRLNFVQPKPDFPEVCCLLASPPPSSCSTVDWPALHCSLLPHRQHLLLGRQPYGAQRVETGPVLVAMICGARLHNRGTQKGSRDEPGTAESTGPSTDEQRGSGTPRLPGSWAPW